MSWCNFMWNIIQLVMTERPYILVAVNFRRLKHHLGELYSLITTLLTAPGSDFGYWILKEAASYPFDVCLGESIGRGIPFKALSTNASSRIRPPLVNFYQHFKQLTWKLDMVVTLEKSVALQ
jgi:hypothetical protein